MNNKKIKKHNAFTLIEVLIALVIFAIIGILAAMSLRSMIRTHERLKKADRSIMQLQMTMTLMRRDFMQMIDRPVLNSLGEKEAALLSEGANKVVFTRTGLVNPLGAYAQSNMQRVGYALDGTNLVRLTWDVLDEAPHTQPEVQILLSHVKSLHWEFLARDGKTSAAWPPAIGSNMQAKDQSPLPKVILLVMQIEHEGVVEGVFPVPAWGHYDSKNTALP